jgi:hypothetical protein
LPSSVTSLFSLFFAGNSDMGVVAPDQLVGI